MQEVLAIKPGIHSPARPAAWDPNGKIEFRNVSLVVNDKTILKDINLTIPAGATYAVVGPLGSGKTSLMTLIPRLQDATTGQVLIWDAIAKKFTAGAN